MLRSASVAPSAACGNSWDPLIRHGPERPVSRLDLHLRELVNRVDPTRAQQDEPGPVPLAILEHIDGAEQVVLDELA